MREGDAWSGWADYDGIAILESDGGSSCLNGVNNETYTGCEITIGCDLICSDNCTVMAYADAVSIDPPSIDAPPVSVDNTGVEEATVGGGDAPAVEVTKIDFLFPLVAGVGNTLQILLSEMVDVFNQLNPEIQVNAIYTGGYVETMDKVMARVDAGIPPAVAVVNVNRMVELKAKDAIIPLNDYVKEAGGYEFM